MSEIIATINAIDWRFIELCVVIFGVLLVWRRAAKGRVDE